MWGKKQLRGLEQKAVLKVVQKTKRPVKVVFERDDIDADSGSDSSRTASEDDDVEEEEGDEFTFEFVEGKLGLTFRLNAAGELEMTACTGQAESFGIMKGDIIIGLEGESVRGLNRQAFASEVTKCSRPCEITFLRRYPGDA